MGAHDFMTICRGKTLGEAYRSSCEDARSEYGHDPYNGTISTTNGVIPVLRESMLTEAAAKRQAQAICFDDEKMHRLGIRKWEACGGIAFYPDSAFRMRRRTVTVELQDHHTAPELLETMIAKAVELAPGELISEITASGERQTRYKTSAKKTDGKAKTTYEVRHGQQVVARAETAAEARKAAQAWIERQNQAWVDEVELKIYGVVAREDGQPLDLVRRSATRRRQKYQVRIARPAKPLAEAKPAGYVMFGLAAS